MSEVAAKQLDGQDRKLTGRRAFHEAKSRTSRWHPVNEAKFLSPGTPEERAEVVRVMRGAIEQEYQFAGRMKAICDLLALMTPENVDDFRQA